MKMLMAVLTVALVTIVPSLGAPPEMGDNVKLSRFVSGVVYTCIDDFLKGPNHHQAINEVCTLGCTMRKLVQAKWRHTFNLIYNKGLQYECVEKQTATSTDPCKVGALIIQHCKPVVKSAPLVNLRGASQSLAILFGKLG